MLVDRVDVARPVPFEDDFVAFFAHVGDDAEPVAAQRFEPPHRCGRFIRIGGEPGQPAQGISI